MNADQAHQAELEAARFERAHAILAWCILHGMPFEMWTDLRVELGLATGVRVTVGADDGDPF
jgi:hypothetical protein